VIRLGDFLTADDAADSINLGGGFALVDDATSGPIIQVTALADTGACGLASPVTVDARLDVNALAWIARSGVAPGRRLCSLDQVHGVTCAAADDGESTEPGLARLANTDAVWTRSPDDILIVRTADCAAVWLADPQHAHIALVHAGWRGAADGIVRRAVDTLVEQGAHRDFIVAAIGPHIGRCCFEVGPDVASHFADIEGAISPPSVLTAPRMRTDSVSLNLGAVLAAQLHTAGVPSDAIAIATACTRCFTAPDGTHVLHSYRRNGSGGPLMGSIAFLEQ
jgi:YfiH family protein